MSWRTVVISHSAKLDYQLGYLVVRRDDVVKVHLSEISTLIIETTSVSLTAALLTELVKKKIKVIFCDEKRNPSSELIPYYGAHDTSAKLKNQIEWNKDVKSSVWTEIVKYENKPNILRFGICLNRECYMNILMKFSLAMQPIERDMRQKYISMHCLVWILQEQPRTVLMQH